LEKAYDLNSSCCFLYSARRSSLTFGLGGFSDGVIGAMDVPPVADFGLFCRASIWSFLLALAYFLF
jgi:hypothetical protein